MEKNKLDVAISDNFKKMTVKAIFSIVLFVIVYLLLIVGAIALTILFGYIGLFVIAARPSFLTIVLGAGIISIGLLIFIFLIKFLFTKHVTDRSHLVEIKRTDEPKLFALVEEIVKEVNTDFPKKIYLSAEVNASVFYDSSFWSMFLPIRKNLQIGLGLMNSITTDECKAILAHEFGHFSQRSMKVGSYVYNVNQIIYNMLFDNQSYQSLVQAWASISGYLTFFVSIAVGIVQGIQKILRKMYEIVNVNYLGLSREMEFHADAVAANIAGSKPMVNALLRLDLADNALNAVLSFYESKIKVAQKTENLFTQHQHVMAFLGKENDLGFENNLPKVDLQYTKRFNKSKLVITNQWASHPSIEDRVAELTKLGIDLGEHDNTLAIHLLQDPERTSAQLTAKIFSKVEYKEEVSSLSDEAFSADYHSKFNEQTFSKVFNSYYDNKNPSVLDLESITAATNNLSMQDVFSNDAVDLVYHSIALENDVATLKQLSTEEVSIKSFDYDGIKYAIKDAPTVLIDVEKQAAEQKEKIKEVDTHIYAHFLSLAQKTDKEDKLKSAYQAYIGYEKDFQSKVELFTKMVNAVQFTHQTNAFEIIEQNMDRLKLEEKPFKEQIQTIIETTCYQSVLTEETKENLTKYTSKNWLYFIRPKYDDDALNVLFNAINGYQEVIYKAYFKIKKELLQVFEELAISK